MDWHADVLSPPGRYQADQASVLIACEVAVAPYAERVGKMQAKVAEAMRQRDEAVRLLRAAVRDWENTTRKPGFDACYSPEPDAIRAFRALLASLDKPTGESE